MKRRKAAAIFSKLSAAQPPIPPIESDNMLFCRGHIISGGSAGERNHGQLWVPKTLNKVAHLRRLIIGCTGNWEAVMTSTKLGNQPFAGSPLPNGISTDGTFTGSGAEILDQRSLAVQGAQMFHGTGSMVFDWEYGEFIVSPNWGDTSETGGGLMIRSENNTTVIRASYFWEEVPRP